MVFVMSAGGFGSPFGHLLTSTEETVIVELSCLHVIESLRLNCAAILVEVDSWQHSIKGAED